MSFKTYDSLKIEKILKMIQETWPSKGPFTLERVKNNITIKKDPNFWKDYIEVDRTDGIGFIIVVDEKAVDDIINIVKKHHQTDVIGNSGEGHGSILIDSYFDNGTVAL